MKNNINQAYKQQLKQFKQALTVEFTANTDITAITHKLVFYIDKLLQELFKKNTLFLDRNFCLLAVGSYGRQELQLYSDVDLVLLHRQGLCNEAIQSAQSFIQDCWDVGLEISHQITSVENCATLAMEQLSFISTLLDKRLICGCGQLMEELSYAIHPLHMWSSALFFQQKCQEQNLRYKKYDETAYNLEPNIKYGPGGLRDLQILLSVAKRHFSISKLSEAISCQFISEKEYEALLHCQYFLWRARFALHSVAGKQEERLLFDHQIKLAQFFGFTDNEQSLAIEQFMKNYFKVIKQSRELNELLLQTLEERIIPQHPNIIISLDQYFQLTNNFIEVKHHLTFMQNPPQLLALFLWIASLPTIAGVKAGTIRLVRQSLFLINRQFRRNSQVIQTFRALFKRENNPFIALQYMNKYGVLNRYLDCFAAVTGQMQYDLFHIYTVDQHTLFVIRNIVRFYQPEFSAQFNLASKLIVWIKKPDILYLAALFHDIAKGRGGDHSILGSEEAHLFAHNHHISSSGQELLIWLVANHLLMSQTAQRQDIYDPKVIQQFCNKLPHTYYLEYLYLLTVADICATNQHLWNSWKDSLLKELYHGAKRALKVKEALLNEEKLIHNRRYEALALLINQGFDSDEVTALWDNFKSRYFLHESSAIIALHTAAILKKESYPLIVILPHHSQGGTEIFIYMPHRDNRFSITTTVLNNHQVTIQEASILTCENNFDLDTYIVLDEQHQQLLSDTKATYIKQVLASALSGVKKRPVMTKRRLSRRQAHFYSKPELTFVDDQETTYTCLFLVMADRPGLLAKVSTVFAKLQIHLHNAKIATAGERAEDMFYILNRKGELLDTNEKLELQERLIKKLSH